MMAQPSPKRPRQGCVAGPDVVGVEVARRQLLPVPSSGNSGSSSGASEVGPPPGISWGSDQRNPEQYAGGNGSYNRQNAHSTELAYRDKLFHCALPLRGGGFWIGADRTVVRIDIQARFLMTFFLLSAFLSIEKFFTNGFFVYREKWNLYLSLLVGFSTDRSETLDRIMFAPCCNSCFFLLEGFATYIRETPPCAG